MKYRPVLIFIGWHACFWLADTLHYHLCAKHFFWSLVTRDSDVCRTLKTAIRFRP